MFKLKNLLLKHYRLLSFICGGIAVLALPPFYKIWTLFPAFSLLLWYAGALVNPKQVFKSGYYFGFAYFAFGLCWINNALLLDADKFGWLIPVAFFASGLFFGLFVAIPVWICGFFKDVFARFLGMATLLVLFEWLRSFVLTGFPWNLFGSVLAFSDDLIQIADVFGVYGLSWIVIVVASSPVMLLSAPKWSKISALLVPLILCGIVYLYGKGKLGQYSYEESDTVVRLVQPAIPQSLKWNPAVLEENLTQYIKMSQLPSDYDLDFVIWGETAFPYSMQHDEYHRGQLKFAVPENGALVTGGIRYGSDTNGQYQVYNSMFVVNANAEVIDYYDKSHLVPFGEYVPLRKYLPDWLEPIASQIGSFSSGSGFQPITFADKPEFGGLICYEVIFPHHIADKYNRPKWVINLTNDGWYGDSAGPYQHLVAAKMRAVEEGLTIVRVAGSGISALIAPTGEIIKQLGLNEQGVLDVKLPQRMVLYTIYAKYGNTIILIWCAFVLLWCALRSLKTKV
ncbi:MAG: apolipoprotein N-acyltransferase [Alphaproteobacteria bacterium]|nr:apolipoprotein N-acyltransferase [Alphaproteobacteria bacterium]